VPIPLANVHRIRGERPDLDSAAREYEAVLRSSLGDPPRLDIALLGMGPDGHVCSLFPGHPALEETERYVVPVLDAPKPPRGRITLTLLAIAAARTVVVAAFGEGKAEMARDAIENAASRRPAARALRAGPRALALLDPPAAARLAPVPRV